MRRIDSLKKQLRITLLLAGCFLAGSTCAALLDVFQRKLTTDNEPSVATPDSSLDDPQRELQ